MLGLPNYCWKLERKADWSSPSSLATDNWTAKWQLSETKWAKGKLNALSEEGAMRRAVPLDSVMRMSVPSGRMSTSRSSSKNTSLLPVSKGLWDIVWAKSVLEGLRKAEGKKIYYAVYQIKVEKNRRAHAGLVDYKHGIEHVRLDVQAQYKELCSKDRERETCPNYGVKRMRVRTQPLQPFW